MKKDIGLLEKGLLCVRALMLLNILKSLRELRMYIMNQLHILPGPFTQLRYSPGEQCGTYKFGILRFLLNSQNLRIQQIINERIG
ncbi:hypothetical protein D3C75_939360 [compost metagenome]